MPDELRKTEATSQDEDVALRERERLADAQVRALIAMIPVRKVLTILFTFAIIFASIETWLIVKVLQQEGLLRMQTFNGSIVIIGGLCWAFVFTFVFVWPMKVLNIEGLRLTFLMRNDMKEMGTLVREAKTLLVEFKALLPEAKQAIADTSEVVRVFKARDFSKIEKALTEIETALGSNGDMAKALKGLSELRGEFKRIAEFLARMETEATGLKPEITKLGKTLRGLAEFLDVKVS